MLSAEFQTKGTRRGGQGRLPAALLGRTLRALRPNVCNLISERNWESKRTGEARGLASMGPVPKRRTRRVDFLGFLPGFRARAISFNWSLFLILVRFKEGEGCNLLFGDGGSELPVELEVRQPSAFCGIRIALLESPKDPKSSQR